MSYAICACGGNAGDGFKYRETIKQPEPDIFLLLCLFFFYQPHESHQFSTGVQRSMFPFRLPFHSDHGIVSVIIIYVIYFGCLFSISTNRSLLPELNEASATRDTVSRDLHNIHV